MTSVRTNRCCIKGIQDKINANLNVLQLKNIKEHRTIPVKNEIKCSEKVFIYTILLMFCNFIEFILYLYYNWTTFLVSILDYVSPS